MCTPGQPESRDMSEEWESIVYMVLCIPGHPVSRDMSEEIEIIV